MTTHRARLGAFAFLVLMCLVAWYSVQALAQMRGEPERFEPRTLTSIPDAPVLFRFQ